MRRTMQFGRMLLTATVGLMVCASNARADLFTIDQAESNLSLAVWLTSSGSPILQITGAQFTGSDSTSLYGTLNANVVSGSSITFLTTDNIQLANNATPIAPLADGSSGTAIGQIGLMLTAITSGDLALRGAVGDLTSGALTLSGTSFNASGVTLAYTAGSLAYNTGLGIGSTSTVSSTLNSATAGSFTDSGGIETLTIPIDVIVPVSVGGFDLDLITTGSIVATAPSVPEPGTGTLMAIALVGLAGARWAVRRRGGK